MACLTHEQMLLESLGLEENAETAAHLQTCRSCREQVEAYKELPERFAGRIVIDARNLELRRERLLKSLTERYPSLPAALQTGAKFSWNKKSRLGEMIMRHRFALGGMVVATVALLLVWSLFRPGRLSAMEQTAQAVRNVKSVQCDVTIGMSREGVGEFKIQGKMYRQGAHRRMEMFEKNQLVNVQIGSTDQPGISIDHRGKSYSHSRPMQGKGLQSPLNTLEALGNFSGKSDEDLGTREIGKIKARGFRIDLNKVDPDIGGGSLTVWVAPDTSLPVLVEMEFTLLGGTYRLENFQWNKKLNQQLFQVKPPENYTDRTAPEPEPEKQVAQISAALKTYADASAGQYPQVELIYGDVMSMKLRKKLGIPDGLPSDRAVSGHEAFDRWVKSRFGFGTLNVIQRENTDSGYFGKTVGPTDADKVLFYWKLLDGRYQVIYGDLRADTLEESRLRSHIKLKTK